MGHGLPGLGKPRGEAEDTAVLREGVDAIADLEIGAGEGESRLDVVGLLGRCGLPLRDGSLCRG
jgi:hypothetical protein